MKNLHIASPTRTLNNKGLNINVNELDLIKQSKDNQTSDDINYDDNIITPKLSKNSTATSSQSSNIDITKLENSYKLKGCKTESFTRSNVSNLDTDCFNFIHNSDLLDEHLKNIPLISKGKGIKTSPLKPVEIKKKDVVINPKVSINFVNTKSVTEAVKPVVPLIDALNKEFSGEITPRKKMHSDLNYNKLSSSKSKLYKVNTIIEKNSTNKDLVKVQIIPEYENLFNDDGDDDCIIYIKI